MLLAIRTLCLPAMCFVGAFSQMPPPPSPPLTCQGAGSYNTPVQCAAVKPRNLQTIVSDQQTCGAWCMDQCGPSGATGGRFSVGGVCSCQYPRSQRGQQGMNTQLGVCLFEPKNIGVGGPCLEALKIDSLTDMTNESRTAWRDAKTAARRHRQSCDDEPKCEGGCSCVGLWENTTFLASCGACLISLLTLAYDPALQQRLTPTVGKPAS